MADKKSNNIHLQCSACKEFNYISTKNKQKTPEKLALNKYCKRCQGATVHHETKNRK